MSSAIDLLAVALGHHTTPHSTIALGVARAQLIGGHLLGEKALHHGWWERKWVPVPFVAVFVPQDREDGSPAEYMDCELLRKAGIADEQMVAIGRRGGRGGNPARRRFGWRRMATDRARWWDSDFPDRADRSRMVRQHLAAAVQGVRDATGYDVITEAEVDDCASVLCPASWHGLLLCKRVLEIAAVPTRREQEAAE